MLDEAHRLACEIRYIRSLSEHDRRKFFAGAAKHRGEEAARRLAELVANPVSRSAPAGVSGILFGDLADSPRTRRA